MVVEEEIKKKKRRKKGRITFVFQRGEKERIPGNPTIDLRRTTGLLYRVTHQQGGKKETWD